MGIKHTPSEIVLLGGYGENSSLSAALIEKLLKSGRHIAVLAKPSTTLRSKKNLSVHVGDMNDFEFISLTIDNLVTDNKKIVSYIQTAGHYSQASFLDTRFEDFHYAMERNFYCSIAITQKIIKHALENGYEQHLIFLGATGSLRGGKEYSAFCSAKFALRGFAQSLAREFGPKGIHVCHLLVDGIIEGKRATNVFKKASVDCIKGEDLADLIVNVLHQPRSTWTHELDVRPFGEKF